MLDKINTGQMLNVLKQWQLRVLDCLPSAVRQRVAPVVAPYVLSVDERAARLQRDTAGQQHELGQLELDAPSANMSTHSLLANREAPLVLRVPDSWVLRKSTSLPVAAKENLRQVIGFEMDRLTPFSSDQVYYDYRLGTDTPDSETLSVEVGILPRTRIQPWMDQLGSAGVRVDAIRADSLWPEADLLPVELRNKIEVRDVLVNALPVLLLLLLLAVAMALPLWQKHEIASSLQVQEQKLRKEAEVAVNTRAQLNKEREQLQQLQQAWLNYVPTVDVIKALTDLLPDDTSLQQLELKGDVLTMRGSSSQASSLLALLEGAPGFTEAKFMSSVVQQRGKEQFHLSARVVIPFEGVDYAVGTLTETAEPEMEDNDGGSSAQDSDPVPEDLTPPSVGPGGSR